MNTAPAEDRMTVETFVKNCKQCGSTPKKTHKGIIYLYGTVYLDSLYLDNYRVDIFNSHFPLIVIDTNQNIIKFYCRYGPKVKVKDGYKRNFNAIEPTYIVEGLLCGKNELPNSTENNCPEN